MTCLLRSDQVLLTGPLHAGKSTLIRSLLSRMHEPHPRGFFTRCERVEGVNLRTYICAWDGRAEFCMARRDANSQAPFPFVVDHSMLNTAGVALLRPDERETGLFVLDELGVMECGAELFVAAVRALFTRPVPVVAVIQERALPFWLGQLGLDASAPLRFDAGNRERLLEELLARFSAKDAGGFR